MGVAVVRADDLVGAGQHVTLDLGVLELAAHQALDRVDRVLGVRHRLAPGGLADQPLAGLREADHRRRGPRALGVGDHDRSVAVDHRDARVGRAEIDPDDPGHGRPCQLQRSVAPALARPLLRRVIRACSSPLPRRPAPAAAAGRRTCSRAAAPARRCPAPRRSPVARSPRGGSDRTAGPRPRSA